MVIGGVGAGSDVGVGVESCLPAGEVVGDGGLVVAFALADKDRLVERRDGGYRVVVA